MDVYIGARDNSFRYEGVVNKVRRCKLQWFGQIVRPAHVSTPCTRNTELRDAKEVQIIVRLKFNEVGN